MRVRLTLFVVVSLALSAELMCAIPAMADKPAPTPHTTATAGDVWGNGGRDEKHGQTDSEESGSGAKGNDDQSTVKREPKPTQKPYCIPGTGPDCHGPIAPKQTPSPKAVPPSESQLREVAAHLKLPDATPRFGPDPSVNEWNMLAVGYPIWLWTDRPTQLTTTAHNDGLTFALTATWTSTTFTMGDGHTKTCTNTTIRPAHLKPADKPSPTCGYTYQTKSKVGHPYTVTADTHWNIDWATNGHHGTFTHTYTGQRTLDIGELQSLING